MNWKVEAIERLESYGALQNSIQTIPLELKRLQTEATAMRGSAMGTGGERSGRGIQEDFLLNNLMKRQALRASLEQAKLSVKTTEQALKSLTPEELELLELMYIRPRWGNVNQLLVEYGYARATLYRKRDEALKKFALALYGRS